MTEPDTNSQESQPNKLQSIVVSGVLLLLIAGIGYYIYHQTQVQRVTEIVREHGKGQILDLTDLEISDSDLSLIASVLESENLIDMKEIRLANTNTGDAAVSVIVNRFKSTTRLDLSRTKVSSSGIKLLSEMKNVFTLNIVGLELNDDAQQSLLDHSRLIIVTATDGQLHPSIVKRLKDAGVTVAIRR